MAWTTPTTRDVITVATGRETLDKSMLKQMTFGNEVGDEVAATRETLFAPIGSDLHTLRQSLE